MGVIASTLACGQAQTGSGDDGPSSSGPTEDSGTFGWDTHTTPTGDDGNTMSPCEPTAQDCPMGFKCVPAIGGSVEDPTFFATCVPLPDDPKSIGEICDLDNPIVNDGASDPCGADSVCVSTGGNHDYGVCLELCTNDFDPCLQAGHVCIVLFKGLVPLCLPTCHPLGNDCEENGGCYYHDPSGTFTCQATLPNAGTYGDPCDIGVQNLCRNDFACWSPIAADGCAGQWCCTPYCDKSEPNPCEGEGEECIAPWDGGPAPSPDLETVGACAIPT